MRKTIFTISIICLLMLGGVFALDANNPYTVTLQWIVPSDTTFTVELAGSESTIDFNPSGKTENYIEPDGQDASGSTPIATITNAGNVNMNFTNNLTASKPAWATLMVSNTNDETASTSFDTTAVLIEADVVAAGTSDVYLWSNISDGDAGTTQRTYQINALDNS